MINLPERRLSPAPLPRKREVPIEEILRVMGNNPVGQSLPGIGQQLGEALMVAAQRRKQQEQMAALGEELGVPGERFSKLSPEGANLIARSLINKREEEENMLRPVPSHGGSVKIAKDPLTGEVLAVFPDGSTRKIAGTPQPAEPGKQRANIQQFNAVERRVLSDAAEDFEKNKVVSEISQRLSRANELRGLIEKNPEGAIGIIQTQFTKFSGEVGRLTDEDINRNSGSPAAAAQIKRTAAKYLTGKLSQQDVGDFMRILEIVEKVNRKKLDGLMMNKVQEVSQRVPNTSPELIRQQIGGTIGPSILPSQGAQNGTWDAAKERRYQELKRRQMGGQ